MRLWLLKRNNTGLQFFAFSEDGAIVETPQCDVSTQ